MQVIPRSFYERERVVVVARELLGKVVYTQFDGVVTGGIIVETEAYEGVTDRASHAYGSRRTPRTEVMYAVGGTAYVYLCYGIHSLFNVVTNKKDVPHAVLIRSIRPVAGFETMLARSGKKSMEKDFGNGPGKVSKILGIHFSHTGLDLTKKPSGKSVQGIWLEDDGREVVRGIIVAGPRIGVDYAGEDALLPYRFRMV
ncbi:MAG: DNA-3-methyladenine glycosylase [Bacteroidetes bacterium]|nr:DNA-3-methyladenine glycosylase [Bacteroidota bacterium]